MLWNASLVRSWIPMSVIPRPVSQACTSQDAWVADLIASPGRCNRPPRSDVCHGQEEVLNMTSITVEHTRAEGSATALRTGSWLMGIAAAGFIGYAVNFSARNITSSLVELGIQRHEGNVER